MPLLIGQGLADVVVYPQVNDTYVDGGVRPGRAWSTGGCRTGTTAASSPRDSPITDELVAWTQDRVDGTPQASGCQRR